MKPEQSSATAENNVLLRAHEFLHPENERICIDPYAAYFVPERIFSAGNRNDQIKHAVADWETRFPGVCNAIIARTGFIDDCLEEALSDGIQQLVILGAGYDTRALRFEALNGAVAVFELDHPATQKKKMERMMRFLETDLPHVRYIPMDFSKEDLADKLLAGGYEPRLKTLFIWEGVTYYLPASAVDHTLEFIHRRAAAKSSVIFDYFPPTVADGTTRLPEAKALRWGLKCIGEEIVFGIAPDRIGSFMKERGFTVIRNLVRADFKKAYFKGPNMNRSVSEMFVFVQALVS